MRKHFFVLALIALLPSCGLFKKEEVVEKPSGIAVVGEVTSVHEKEGFVLFRRYGPGDLLSDGTLSARSLDGRRAASLTLSPETLGRFYTADFDKGAQLPRKGDVVVLLKEPDDTEAGKIGEEIMADEDETLKKVNPSEDEKILNLGASQSAG